MARPDRPLVGTYRLQLTAGDDFAAVATQVDELAALGVSHLYLSPVAEAVPGSTHGYDVADPSHLRDELGGEEGFRALVAAAHAAGLGVVLDIVPNHLAAHPSNPWWWDVLRLGERSHRAEAFDIDWAPPKAELRGKVLLPVLGDHYGRELESGTLRIDRGEVGPGAPDGHLLVLRYHDLEMPVRPASVGSVLEGVAAALGDEALGLAARVLRRSEAIVGGASERGMAERDADIRVAEAQVVACLEADPAVGEALDAELAALNADPDALDALVAVQHHRPARWRVGWAELDYRRFFDIDDLVATRIERPSVFEAMSELPVRLVTEGLVDGVRVDHVDGLRDPEAYLAALRDAIGDEPWLVVEKILRPGEPVPPSWRTDGTTGYEVADLCTGLLVDPTGAERLLERWRSATGETATFAEVALVARHQILAEGLAADVERLTDLLVTVCESRRRQRDHARPDLRDALVQLAAHSPAYRAYVRFEGGDPHRPVVTPADEAFVRRAVGGALEAAGDALDPELAQLLEDVLCGRAVGDAEAELVSRFQQLTGPVIAKGDEDTAVYRWTPLLARCEVGVEPDRLAVEPAHLHAEMAEAQRSHPARMTTLSTHDTKRAADVRARIALFASAPDAFADGFERWWDAAADVRGDVDPGTGWFVLQTVVGAHPLPTDRAWPAVEKALREAKLRTTWTDPDEAYESAVEALVDASTGDGPLAALVAELARPFVDPGRAAALVQLALQLVAPGVPDTYQGGERWDLSLVDPDNRRPVDRDGRRAVTAVVAADGAGTRVWADEALRDAGAPKALVLRELLALRRRHAAAFGAGPAGAWTPLRVAGAGAGRVVGVGRGAGPEVVVVVARPDLDGWAADATVTLPAGRWRDALTGAEHAGGADVAWAALGATLPVVALERV